MLLFNRCEYSVKRSVRCIGDVSNKHCSSFLPWQAPSWRHPWRWWICTSNLGLHSWRRRRYRSLHNSSLHWRLSLATYFYRRSRSRPPWLDAHDISSLDREQSRTFAATCGRTLRRSLSRFRPSRPHLHRDHSKAGRRLVHCRAHQLASAGFQYLRIISCS